MQWVVDCTSGGVQPGPTQPNPENWVGSGWSSQPDGSGWVQILKPDPNLSIGSGQVLHIFRHIKLYLAVLMNYKVPKKCQLRLY